LNAGEEERCLNTSILSGYSWWDLWSPMTFAVVVLFSVLYYKKMVVSSRYSATGKQIACFFIAAFFFYIVKGSPVKIIADTYLFSAHVVEIMSLLFIILPLLILSIPAEWARQYVWNHRLKFAIRLFGHPWLAALLFNGALSTYFVPDIFNVVHDNVLFSALSQLFLLVTGFFYVVDNHYAASGNQQIFLFYTGGIHLFKCRIAHANRDFSIDCDQPGPLSGI